MDRDRILETLPSADKRQDIVSWRCHPAQGQGSRTPKELSTCPWPRSEPQEVRAGVEIILQPAITGDCSGRRSREQSMVLILCGTHVRGAEEGPGRQGRSWPWLRHWPGWGHSDCSEAVEKGQSSARQELPWARRESPWRASSEQPWDTGPCSGARLSRTPQP